MVLDRSFWFECRRRILSVDCGLPFLWITGLLLGNHFAKANALHLRDLMLSAVAAKASFLSGFLVSALWILLTCFLIRKRTVLMLPLAFAKAWRIGFTGGACTCVFGHAAWLIRGFVLFSSYLNSVIFLLLFYCGFWRSKTVVRILLVITALVEMIDSLLISHYLATLF